MDIKKREKLILGIDPGSQFVGYGLLKSVANSRYHSDLKPVTHGVLRLNLAQANSLEERLVRLGRGLREILIQYRPDEVAVEKIFLGRNADSAFKLGHARGVVLYECQAHTCKIFEYATRSVKKGVTGRGGAEKEEVRAVLQALLGISERLELDASDALALAYHHSVEVQKGSLFERTI